MCHAMPWYTQRPSQKSARVARPRPSPHDSRARRSGPVRVPRGRDRRGLRDWDWPPQGRPKFPPPLTTETRCSWKHSPAQRRACLRIVFSQSRLSTQPFGFEPETNQTANRQLAQGKLRMQLGTAGRTSRNPGHPGWLCSFLEPMARRVVSGTHSQTAC